MCYGFVGMMIGLYVISVGFQDHVNYVCFFVSSCFFDVLGWVVFVCFALSFTGSGCFGSIINLLSSKGIGTVSFFFDFCVYRRFLFFLYICDEAEIFCGLV